MSRRQWVVETVDSDGGDNTWAGHAANDREARRAAINHHEAASTWPTPKLALHLGPVHRTRHRGSVTMETKTPIRQSPRQCAINCLLAQNLYFMEEVRAWPDSEFEDPRLRQPDCLRQVRAWKEGEPRPAAQACRTFAIRLRRPCTARSSPTTTCAAPLAAANAMESLVIMPMIASAATSSPASGRPGGRQEP